MRATVWSARSTVNDAWLMAWDHELLVIAIEASCGAADDLRHGSADELDRLGWALLRFMLCEFRVETALLTGATGPGDAMAFVDDQEPHVIWQPANVHRVD